MTFLSLNDIKPGEKATVSRITATGPIRRRLMDIGFTKNAHITCVGESPHRDPRAFLVRGAVIAIRSEDSKNILVYK